MAKLKWFGFDLALKLALYTYKKKKKKKKAIKQSQYSVCYLQGQVKMASVTCIVRYGTGIVRMCPIQYPLKVALLYLIMAS